MSSTIWTPPAPALSEYSSVVVDTSSVISLSRAVGRASPSAGARFFILPGVRAELRDHYDNCRINRQKEISDQVLRFMYDGGSLIEFDYRSSACDAERYVARVAEAAVLERRTRQKGPLSDADREIAVYAIAQGKPVLVLTEDQLLRDTLDELRKPGHTLDRTGKLNGNGYPHVQLGTYKDLLPYWQEDGKCRTYLSS